jgi:D-beta-D-heptose 7-phosphate kinase/D-beta-D-heptose 1-phosphate adenosyltransferase
LSAELSHIVQGFAERHVLVVGDVMLDRYYSGSGIRLCQEGPVPVVERCSCLDLAGGAANAAANAAALGSKVSLAGVTGEDESSEALRHVLDRGGVSCEALLCSAERQTLCKQRVCCDSQLVVRFDQGSTSPLEEEVVARLLVELDRQFAECDTIVLSDYGYGTFTPFVIERIARLQARHQRFIALDSKWPTRFRDVGVTLLKQNFQEAAATLAAAEERPHDRTRWAVAHADDLFASTSAQCLAITLDRDGAVVIDRHGDSHHVKATRAAERCTSGAGDSFVTTLALALSSGADVSSATCLAGAAASVVIREERKRTCSQHELIAALSNTRRSSSLDDLVTVLDSERAAGKRIVLTNGCFDILHRGHISYLREARRLGDVLVVGVNTDESIRRLKGPHRPINSLSDRLEVLAGLADVDYLIPFGEDTPHRLVEAIRPDVFVKGGDYTRKTLPEAELVERLGGRVAILPYLPQRSTTRIIDRIRQTTETPLEAGASS